MGPFLIADIGGFFRSLLPDPMALLHNIYAWALVVVGIGFVIFIHELGHFLVAKWAGVKVEMFSIGFGPTLVSWRKGFGFRFGSTAKEYAARLNASEDEAALTEAQALYGETEYSLRALPLGGFVLMLGEDPGGEEAKTTDPRAFQNKPVGARMAILAAGVIMNMIFGVACATWTYMRGKLEIPAVVGAVVAGQPAYEAGIQPGDEILAIDGRPDITFQDLTQTVQTSASGHRLKIEIKRKGEAGPVVLEIEPRRAPSAGGPTLGVTMPGSLKLFSKPPPPKGLVANETETDRVVAIGPEGETPSPVADLPELEAILSRYRDRPLTIVAERGPTEPDPEAKSTKVEAVVPPRLRVDFGMRMTPGPIVAIRPDSPASLAGFRVGDRIVSVAGRDDFDPTQLPEIASASAGKPMVVEVSRGPDVTSRIEVTPTDAPIGIESYQDFEPLDVPGLGLAMAIEPRVAAVVPGSPADKAKIRVGDVVKSVRVGDPQAEGAKPGAAPSWSKPLVLEATKATWPAILDAVQFAPVPVEFDLGKAAPVVLEPVPVPGRFATMRGLKFQTLTRMLPPQPFLTAVRRGLRDTKDMSLSIFALIRNMIQGRTGLESGGSILKIADIGFTTAKFGGLEAFLTFLGLLSVNLAVMNILPIPPLDGGQIAFLVAEKVRGRPLPESALAYPKIIGLILLLGLILLFFFKDLISYF